MAEREPEATLEPTRGRLAPGADGTPVVAPAILALPAIPAAGSPRDDQMITTLQYVARI
ncbi:MAG TPA: hypothetical protein VHM69_12105 [Rubrobacter sp.]|nr:hypothetical protein [Rubrobacter sp.]